MRTSPFDHRPQRDLGKTLRELLEAGDNRAFVARVMAKVRALDIRRLHGDWWKVLVAWARPGLVAAAALVVLAFGWTLATAPTAPVEQATAEEALRAATDASVLTVAADPPDVGFILAAFPER
jgi:hypothetical protein